MSKICKGGGIWSHILSDICCMERHTVYETCRHKRAPMSGNSKHSISNLKIYVIIVAILFYVVHYCFLLYSVNKLLYIYSIILSFN